MNNVSYIIYIYIYIYIFIYITLGASTSSPALSHTQSTPDPKELKNATMARAGLRIRAVRVTVRIAGFINRAALSLLGTGGERRHSANEMPPEFTSAANLIRASDSNSRFLLP